MIKFIYITYFIAFKNLHSLCRRKTPRLKCDWSGHVCGLHPERYSIAPKCPETFKGGAADRDGDGGTTGTHFF